MATKPRAILLLLPWTLCASSLPGGGNVTCDDSVQCSSVQSLSRVRLSATPWTAASQSSLSIDNSQSLLRLTPFESVMPSSHLILCRPLLPHLQTQHQGLFQWMVTIRDEMGAWTRQQPWRGEEIGMCLTGHRGDHIC